MQTSPFTCVKSNAIDREQQIFITGIKRSTCLIRRLNRTFNFMENWRSVSMGFRRRAIPYINQHRTVSAARHWLPYGKAPHVLRWSVSWPLQWSGWSILRLNFTFLFISKKSIKVYYLTRRVRYTAKFSYEKFSSWRLAECQTVVILKNLKLI